MTARLTVQRGLALIAVLWAIALLSIMAGSFSLTLQRDSGLLRTAQDRAKGLALAEAGVNYAMLMLGATDPALRWRGDGVDYEVAFPIGSVRVRIFDEAGKLDINAAQEVTLRSIFTQITGNPDAAAQLSDAVLDWRDPDDMKRPQGAEAAEYTAAGKNYVPQNRIFQTLEELQMVQGMTPALYKKIEPLLTTHSRQAGINPVKASRETLLALPGLDEKTVDAYIQQRRFTLPNTPPPPLQLPPGIPVSAAADLAYTIIAETQTQEGARVGLKTVVTRQGGRGPLPFSYASWKPLALGTSGASGTESLRP
jgi:general secretion pathway protein K